MRTQSIFAAALLVAAGTVSRAPAADRLNGVLPAVSVSPKGMFLIREDTGDKWVPGSKWSVVDANAKLPSDHLLVGLPGAKFDTSDRTVHAALLTDFDSPLPVVEPAVLLNPPQQRALDFVLDRGMIELVSGKTSGSSIVRVHVRGDVFDLTLYAGSKVTLLLASTWPKGAPFKAVPGPKDVPAAELLVVVQKGEVDVRHSGKLLALQAPPGPAVLQWDSVNGLDDSATHLDKLPDWILPPTNEEQKAKTARLNACVAAFCKEVANKPLDTVLDQFLESDNKTERHFAVILLGATDNLGRLAIALNSTKHIDIWDHTVRALRHWIGRGPGQDQVLYKRLVELRGYKPAEAATVLHFLHTPDDDEIARPETYEMLIDHLNSDRLAIRGLAFWHLYRLVPAGRKIAYDPLAPREQREQAKAEWKKLIPEGQMPPKAQPEQERKP
jgi:hypothetical protein